MLPRPGLRRVTPPATLPVTLDEAKAHLRVRHSADDTRITRLISSAATLIDGDTRHMSVCMVPQTWAQTFDFQFPHGACVDEYNHAFHWLGGQSPIELLRRPVIAVTSIAYVDTAGATQVLSADTYDVFLAQGLRNTLVAPKPFTWWPQTEYRREAVAVTFTAGFAAGVPDPVKDALLFIIEDLYLNRTRDDAEINGTARALLTDFRRTPV